jgi:hypothetical protein
MTRLQKFVERARAHGEGSGRHAYVLQSSALPRASNGMEWHAVKKFNAADEVLKNPGLKAVFQKAIETGCAIVTKF